jgi:uncharacterized membrane protein
MALLAAMPFLELRASIPFGLAAGIEPATVFWVSLLINVAIIPVIFVGFKYLFDWLCSVRFIGKIFDSIRMKTDRKARKYLEKYGPIGLLLFVAIPLPGTGAYSGCLAMYLLDLPRNSSFVAVAAGVLIAGVLVFLASTGVLSLF